MYILDKATILKRLKQKGYGSIQALADRLGLHRNTLYYFLSGHQVLPESIEKIMEALSLTPADLLVKQPKIPISLYEPIAPLIDTLHQTFPEVTFILFGSRARGTASQYADWDIGVYSRNRIPHHTYLKICQQKNELVETSPFLVDLTNLNRADHEFLKNAAKGWLFLNGWQQDWIDLQKKITTSSC